MIDIKRVREDFDATAAQLARRGVEQEKVAKARDLDAKRRVPLVQPQFPEVQVLYIEAYFMHFVKRYKWAFAMPRWLGKPYEKWLDHRVTGKFIPRQFYVWLHDRYTAVRNKLKDFLVHHLPKLYLKLRMLKHRKREEKA